MYLEIIAIVFFIGLALKIGFSWNSGRCVSKRTLLGKTAIITGASAGIGKAAARDLAFRGARLILACRNLEKASLVAEEIINQTGNSAVIVRHLDTSDLSSVRKFATGILATEDALHILVNNAGIGGMPMKILTKDGLELTMATNYYGHFLLTNLLIGLLKRSSPSRVVNVSSLAHKFALTLDLSNLNCERSSYNPIPAYQKSKLCNILFTKILDKKLQGTGVTANSLNPGLVATEIFQKSGQLMGSLLAPVVKLIGKDETAGAQTTIYLAVSEEVEGVSGKYFADCKEQEPSSLANNFNVAEKLWETSELHVKITSEEKSSWNAV